jgi:hypothetical protein
MEFLAFLRSSIVFGLYKIAALDISTIISSSLIFVT